MFPAAWLLPAAVCEKALETDRFGYNCGLTSLVGGNDYKFLGQPITHIYPLLTLVDSHPYTGIFILTWQSWYKLTYQEYLI